MLRAFALPALAALAAVAAPPLANAQEALERAAHARLLEGISAPGARLAPFTTDGCSGGLSDVWVFVGEGLPAFAEAHGRSPPWESCCVIHDRAYQDARIASGTDAAEAVDTSYAERLAADTALRVCVRATADGREDALGARYGLGPEAVATAYDMIAAAMYRAVRLGGAPCTGLPWRWGYGWPDC